jgi:lysophospholipase L1-like esterase
MNGARQMGCARAAAISGLTLIGLLVALEGALRVGGGLHRRYERQAAAAPAATNAALRILCIGDSFTVGMGAPAGRGYPAQLAECLRACTALPLCVINAGAASQNTAQMLQHLPAQLARHRPHAVVILAGFNNSWNYWGRAGRLSRVLNRIRVYRLWRHLHNAMQRMARRGDAGPAARDIAAVLRAARRHDCDSAAQAAAGLALLRDRQCDEALPWLERAVLLDARNSNAWMALAGAHTERGRWASASTCLTTACASNPGDARLWFKLGAAYSAGGEHACAVTNFARGLRVNPSLRELHDGLRVTLLMPDASAAVRARAVELQQAYAAYATGTLHAFADIVVYQDMRCTATPSQEAIRRWVQHDLTAMIALCRHAGAAVILMTYPLKWTALDMPGVSYEDDLNDMVRALARAGDVYCVDLRAAFDRFGADKRTLFEPAELMVHPNHEGYGIVTRGVCAALARRPPPVLAADARFGALTNELQARFALLGAWEHTTPQRGTPVTTRSTYHANGSVHAIVRSPAGMLARLTGAWDTAHHQLICTMQRLEPAQTVPYRITNVLHVCDEHVVVWETPGSPERRTARR